MTASQVDFELDAGKTFKRVLHFKNADGTSTDLTGQVFAGQIRNLATDPAALADFTFTLLDQTQLATRGRVVVSLTPTQTKNLPTAKQKVATERVARLFAYDIERTMANSEVRGVCWGVLSVFPEVTRG